MTIVLTYVDRATSAKTDNRPKFQKMIADSARKQLDDISKRIDNILTAIEEGLFNASAKRRLDDLESKKQDIEISLAREKIEKTPLSHEQIVFWISKFRDGDIGDPTYRQAIVDIFVNSIFLYDDKLVIGFNWQDGTKTMMLEELEAASKKVTNGKMLNLSGNLSSFLDDTAPSVRNKCEPHRMVLCW